MTATLARDAQGELVRKAGVMAVVRAGGEVRPGDAITIELPPEPHLRTRAPTGSTLAIGWSRLRSWSHLRQRTRFRRWDAHS